MEGGVGQEEVDWGGRGLRGQGMCGGVGGVEMRAARAFGLPRGLGVYDVLKTTGCAAAMCRA